MAEERAENRTIFVGYPYALPKDDYRGVFAEVAEEHKVKFLFADEELISKHILEKIVMMMNTAAFSLFDLTYWNPNVAVELGIAYGSGLDFFILYDPTKENRDVLSDLRGIDRIEYGSYKELKDHLSKLMVGQFGAPQEAEPEGGVMAQLEQMRERIPDLLKEQPGLHIGDIASSLGVPVEIAQTLVRPMVGEGLETRGIRRGMTYYVQGEALPDEEEDVQAVEVENDAADNEGRPGV
jgi:hypothetical protein